MFTKLHSSEVQLFKCTVSYFCSTTITVIELNWSFIIKFKENLLKNRHAVLYWIGYVYQLENIFQYWLLEYRQVPKCHIGATLVFVLAYSYACITSIRVTAVLEYVEISL